MKKILSFLAILICIQSMGQKPWNIQKPTGQVIKQQEMVKEAMKSQAEKQAAIDKVLNSKITRISLTVKNYSTDSWRVFENRVANINFPGTNIGYSAFVIKETSKSVYGPREYIFPDASTPKVTSDYIKTITYQTLLETGFEMLIKFEGRIIGYRVPAPGTDWSADFFVEFFFDNTPSVKIPLQDGLEMAGKKGSWVSKGDLKIDKKIPGSVFPDPANPFLLPGVK